MVAERTGSWRTSAEGSEESVLPESGDPWPRRKRILTVAGLAVAALTFDWLAAERHGYFDLNVYHGAINYWVHQGGSIYDFVLPFSTYGFTYPPFAALVMLPMAVTPWHLAIVISCVTCAVVTAMLIYWFVDPIA